MIQQIQTATAPPGARGGVSDGNGPGEGFSALLLAAAGKAGRKTVPFGRASAGREISERRDPPGGEAGGDVPAMTGMLFYIPGSGASGLPSAPASFADDAAVSAASSGGIAGTGGEMNPASGAAADTTDPLLRTGEVAAFHLGQAHPPGGEGASAKTARPADGAAALPSADLSERPKDGDAGPQTVPRENSAGRPVRAASPKGTANPADAAEPGPAFFAQANNPSPVSEAARGAGTPAEPSLPAEGPGAVPSFDAVQTAEPPVSSGLAQGALQSALPIRPVSDRTADTRGAQTPGPDAAQVSPASLPTGAASAIGLEPASGTPPEQAAGTAQTASAIPPAMVPKGGEPAPGPAEDPSEGRREDGGASIRLPGGPASVEGNRETAAAEDPVEKPAQEFSAPAGSDAAKTDADIPETGRDAEKDTGDSGSRQTDEKAAASGLYAASSAGAARTVVPISDASTRIRKPVLQQVTDQIAGNFRQDKSEFQMELYPERLGKVSVKLSMENGTLTVSLSADDPKTQSLLMSRAGDIRSMLRNTMDRNVQVADPQQSAWYQPQQDASRQQPQQQPRRQAGGTSAETGEVNGAGGAEDFLTVMQRLRMRVVLS